MNEDTLRERGAVGLDSRSVYRGKILEVREDRVLFPGGSEAVLEVVRHGGAAAVLPVYVRAECPTGTGPDVLLLRQYRHAAGCTLWEAPAGKLDAGEEPEACAVRDLEEEAGVRAERVQRLTTLYTTPGFSDERIHLFVATGLAEGRRSHEPHELIECHRLSLERALSLVRSGEIVDGKTVCLLLLAASLPELQADR